MRIAGMLAGIEIFALTTGALTMGGCQPSAQHSVGDVIEPLQGTGDRPPAAATSIAFSRIFYTRRSNAPNVCNRLFPEPRSIAIGPDGDIWIAGTFLAPIEFGDTTLVSSGGADVFVARLDSAGNPRWSTRFGGVGNDECKGFALDVEGEAIVAYQPPPGGDTVTLAKLGPRGELLWQKDALQLAEHDGRQVVHATTADHAGGILLTGHLDGTMRAGSRTLRGGEGFTFVARVDGNGEVQWATGIGGGSDDVPVSIDVDSSHDIVVGQTHTNGSRIRITKLDSSGALLWYKRFVFATEQNASLSAVATDPQGNILVSGSGSVAFDTGSTSGVKKGSWVAKLDPTGRRLWQIQAGPGYLATDQAGNVLYAAGKTAGKLTQSGARIWSWTAPLTGEAHAGAVTADPAGRLILAGVFQGRIDLGNGSISSGERGALFVVALTP